MGRELRRREEKRNKKYQPKAEEEIDSGINLMTLLKIVFGMFLILVVVYYILAVFVTKEIDISNKNSSSDNSSDTTSTNNNSVSNLIVGANIFNQAEDTYYVYCYNFSKGDEGVNSAISNVSGTTVYRMDTSSGLNSKYVTDGTGNPNATSLNDLKVSDPTLLVISGDKITGYYEGRVAIMKFLGD